MLSCFNNCIVSNLAFRHKILVLRCVVQLLSLVWLHLSLREKCIYHLFYHLHQEANDCIFKEWCEDKDETSDHPDVNGFWGGTKRQAVNQSGVLCCEHQDRKDAERGSGWSWIWVDVERQPGQKDDEETGKIGAEKVLIQLTTQVEVRSQTWKPICTG